MGAKVNHMSSTKMPAKVKRCVTHHYACDCREWKYEQMETALKAIYTLASVELEKNKYLMPVTITNLRNITEMAYKALHCLDEVKRDKK